MNCGNFPISASSSKIDFPHNNKEHEDKRRIVNHDEYHRFIPNIFNTFKMQILPILLLCVEGEKVFDDDDDEVYQQQL